jgi:tetratricopeptide (TPR) repeat protein/predicted Ser/Thr protein kinase
VARLALDRVERLAAGVGGSRWEARATPPGIRLVIRRPIPWSLPWLPAGRLPCATAGAERCGSADRLDSDDMGTDDRTAIASDFQAIEAAFLHVQGLDSQHRAAWLDAHFPDRPDLAARVAALLAHDHTAEFLVGEVEREAARLLAARSPCPQVEGYEILEELGRGGMAVVWSAEQRQPHRIVALKVLAPHRDGPEHLARLLREADVLARLEHPNIARIYAVGQTVDDRPYFAMECVRGRRLDEFVREFRPERSERLRILLQIASAIEHAHQRGVIHRDLKPSNVLIDEAGVPKVVDFGIAWLVEWMLDAEDGAATTTDRSGTLPYMSPEQRRGELARIDTRTDVYGLGALAYELLSGRPPFDLAGMSTAEALRTLESARPLPASHHDRALRGDLDAILAKALAADPAGRYAAVSQFADDVRRHLVFEPVAARPRQLGHVFGRFLRRNRTVAAASTLALLGLVGGLVASLLALSRTHAAELVARQESQTSRQVARRLVRVLSIADEARLTPSASFDDVLTLAIDWLESDPSVIAAVTHEIQLAVGQALLAVERWDAAIPWLESACGDIAANAEDPAICGAALLGLLRAHLGLADRDGAERVLARFEQSRRVTKGVSRAEVLARACHIGWLASQGSLDAAMQSIETLHALVEIAQSSRRRDLILAAVEFRRADVALRSGQRADFDRHLTAAKQFALGDETGEPTQRELEMLTSGVLIAPNVQARRRLSPDRFRMAEQLLAEGRFAEAEAQLRRRLAMPEPPPGRPDTPRIRAMLDLGRAIAAQDRFDEALVLLRDAIARTRKGPRADSMQTILSIVELVELAADAGRDALVLEESQPAIARLREIEPTASRLLGRLLYRRGESLRRLGEPTAALACLREAKSHFESIGADTAAIDASLAAIEQR